MISLEELNELRQQQNWEEVANKAREHLKTDPNATYVLRAFVQALEKQDKRNVEYETALLRLLDNNDRPLETAYKLYQYYKEQGENDLASKNLQTAIQLAADDRQFDQLEQYWMELVDLTPQDYSFFYGIAQKLSDIKQRQRAGLFLQMLLPSTEERRAWKIRLELIRHILLYTPNDDTLRDTVVDTLKNMYPDASSLESIIEQTGIKGSRPLSEALAEMDALLNFIPDSYVRHPDWGVGRVKELDLRNRRVMINFQRKRNHWMDLDLARRSVDMLAPDDFRVLQVIDQDRLKNLVRENPVELVKVLLRSFNGSLNAKEIKEHLMPSIVSNRDWNSWWNGTNSELRKDPFISITGTSTKQYILRAEATSDEDDLLVRFDEIKLPHSKVDLIYNYLRTTKRVELHEYVIKHFSKKIHSLAPKRKGAAERVELWLTNEELKNYSEELESLPQDILDETLLDREQAIHSLQRLRFKNHQLHYLDRMRVLHQDDWIDAFEQLLLEPNVEIRDEIATRLKAVDQEERIHSVVDITLANFRNYPRTFIWLADNVLTGKQDWFKDKLTSPNVIERLLLLVDNLTNQAKRRGRDEALWLRQVAGEAREIIRRNHYALFKQHIQEADEALAASIYRRAQTNEGFDSRTSSDLTTIVRARYPTLFQQVTEEAVAIPDGLLCLKQSFEQKQILLKRLIEKDLPEVVREIETARQHGDLRENAEYHAAKDKQKLLASQVSELQDSMHIAKAVDVETVETDVVRFGTVFKVKPVTSDIVEEYILLGPWESDPDRSILSYQAPFARAFMGKMVGEKVEIELPMLTGRYEIVEISRIPEDRLQEIINVIVMGRILAMTAAAQA